MEKKMTEIFISEKGNALILVVLLVLCMMLIAGGVMAVSFSHVEISQAYKKTSNLYYAAQSGAEKMVDHINKLLLEKMPELMEQASNEAKEIVAPPNSGLGGNYSKLEYKTDDENPAPYGGELILDNLYEDILQEKAINIIVGGVSPIYDTTVLKTFNYTVNNEKNHSFVKVELKAKMNAGEIKGFIVESTATLKKDPSSTEELSKINLNGDIIISDLIGHKELFLEEYRWKNDDLIPTIFRSPILSFGDVVVTEGDSDSTVTINGDVRAKGYIPPPPASGEAFPELENYGGIYVSHGGKLKVNGNITTLANVHTINYHETPTEACPETKIEITGDVAAASVSIEDDDPYYGNSRPTGAKVKNQKITIDGDVYLDNDIAIDYHVEGTPSIGEVETLIDIGGSVYGIMNQDLSGSDPNKSSGIYARGKKTRIEIGQHAFVHGNAFISFDGGRNFHHLFESIGEPYEEVRFLDAYNDISYTGDESYIDLKKEFIPKNKIELDLTNHFFYATRHISANEKLYKNLGSEIKDVDGGTTISHNSFVGQEALKALFNKGGISDLDDLLDISSTINGTKKWSNPIDKGSNSPTIAQIISNAYNYLVETSDETIKPFKRKYFSGTETVYENMSYNKGIQGYMFLLRDIFYKEIDPSNAEPIEMDFDNDIIKSSITIPNNTDTNNTPIFIYNTALGENINIDIEDFYRDTELINTIIIDTGEGTITLGSTDGSKTEFKGLVVSNSQVKFDNSLGHSVSKFTGIIIAKGKNYGNTNMSIADLVSGEYAGVLFNVKDPITIEYDSNILFDLKCKDRSIKRAVFDYLGLTNYVSNVSDVSEILKPSINIEDIQKVDFSPNSVIDIKNTQAYKGVRFEMKTLRQVD